MLGTSPLGLKLMPGEVSIRIQDRDHKGEVSNLRERLDWLGEGPAQDQEGLGKRLDSLNAQNSKIKA